MEKDQVLHILTISDSTFVVLQLVSKKRVLVSRVILCMSAKQAGADA